MNIQINFFEADAESAPEINVECAPISKILYFELF